MNAFKVTYTDGTHYTTNANGTTEEFTAYLMQFGGIVTDENPVTGEETRRIIAKVEQTNTLKSTLEAALDGKATRQDVIAAIDAELAADPEPFDMVEGEGAGQYTFDTPKDSQLAMF